MQHLDLQHDMLGFQQDGLNALPRSSMRWKSTRRGYRVRLQSRVVAALQKVRSFTASRASTTTTVWPKTQVENAIRSASYAYCSLFRSGRPSRPVTSGGSRPIGSRPVTSGTSGNIGSRPTSSSTSGLFQVLTTSTQSGGSKGQSLHQSHGLEATIGAGSSGDDVEAGEFH